MKRVVFSLVAIFALAITTASAQRIAPVKQMLAKSTDEGGVVLITEDEGMQSAIATVEEDMRTPSKAFGYRLLIFYDNEQFADERAARALSHFRARYKNIGSYLSPESPSFRVLVGDCFTQEEVAILRHRIIDEYPEASISDAEIPYRILCRIMKIERSGVVTGGVEAEELNIDADSLHTDELPLVTPDAENKKSDNTDVLKSDTSATELIKTEEVTAQKNEAETAA